MGKGITFENPANCLFKNPKLYKLIVVAIIKNSKFGENLSRLELYYFF